MSSDIMIVCKEFKNFYHGVDMSKDRNPVETAICIGEASMGDPGEKNEFANWFISRYYSGMTMLEELSARGLTKELKDDMLFQHEAFNETDLVACEHALKNMECPYVKEDWRMKDLLEYLKKCIGKHISTENW